MRSRYVKVTVDLDRVRGAAERIKASTGKPLIAVIKADAYGLGASRVADALAGVADDFAYFSIDEAREVGKPGIVLGPPDAEPAEYRELGLRPSVGHPGDAERLRGLPVVLNVDTGMQRFGLPRSELEDVLRRCACVEAFTHANDAGSAQRLVEAVDGRCDRLHAACSSLLDAPEAWLDAVRPGFALYADALRVTVPLVTVRETRGPIGYTEFFAERVGVILAGYSHGMRPGPVVINGRRQRILEVGMNTSFVSIDPRDGVGTEVVLLGDELRPEEVARTQNVRAHEVLCRFSALGARSYAAVGVISASSGAPCTT